VKDIEPGKEYKGMQLKFLILLTVLGSVMASFTSPELLEEWQRRINSGEINFYSLIKGMAFVGFSLFV
jgi:hypothetical protein